MTDRERALRVVRAVVVWPLLAAMWLTVAVMYAGIAAACLYGLYVALHALL